ncbi:GerAB/ArcD/ProY family transporter [Paenibacillus sp. GYB003]|uniref:GerAB/ArcD/ProY family transporter n=1 Tax=Paenibacillus sp. GYB003 TaxID=2994392 RepID=UPI002F96DE30
MANDDRISTRQFTVLVLFITLGDILLVVPSMVAAFVKQDLWISGLVGVFAGLPVALLLYAYGTVSAGTGFVGYNRRLLGRWAGGLVSIVYIVYFLYNCSMMVRETGDFLTTQLFPETPLRAIHVLAVTAMVVGAKYGLQTIARSGEIFLPFYVFLYLMLVVLLLPKIDAARLQPILGSGMPELLHGSLLAASFPFCELCVIFLIVPHVVRSSHLARDYIIAVILGGCGIFVIDLLAVLALGGKMTAHFIYPTYILAQKISIGHFVERLEALLAINHILSTYLKTTLYFYAFSEVIAQLFKLPDYRSLVIPSGLIVFGMAYLVSSDVLFFNDMAVRYWVDMDVLAGFALPLLLLVVHKLKSGRSKRPSNA